MAKAKSPNAMELARGHTRLEQAVQRSRQMLRKRALVAGVAGMVPLPGLDWAADAACWRSCCPRSTPNSA